MGGTDSVLQRKADNIGFIRLLLATAVIVAHSQQLLFGTESEWLFRVTGTRTLGSLAVFCFFMISGYLITQSFMSSSGISSFAWKRFLRLYPAFIVCYVLCIFVEGPFAGARLTSLSMPDWLQILGRLVRLEPPHLNNIFASLQPRDFSLNGSMWSIAYELRCYIIAAGFGVIGLYQRRRLYLALTASAILMNAISVENIAPVRLWIIVPSTELMLQLLAMFMSGSCFFLFRDRILYRPFYAAISLILWSMLLFSEGMSDFGTAIFGGYFIFWLSLHVQIPVLSRINAKDDISYGTYLYAWPVSMMLILHADVRLPLELFFWTIVFVIPLGYLSWYLIEKPALSLKYFNPMRYGNLAIRRGLNRRLR